MKNTNRKMKKALCLALCVCMLAGFAALPASCAESDAARTAQTSILSAPFAPGGLIGYLFGLFKKTAQTANTSSNASSAAQSGAQSATGDGAVQNAAHAYEQEVARLVNVERAKAGLPALTYSSVLSDGAREKSEDMRKNNYFAHESPTYGSPFDQMKSRGITYRFAGENIAMGYRTPEAVVNAWMNSSGHRANILSEKYTEIGVGYVAEGNYWTQWFRG